MDGYIVYGATGMPRGSLLLIEHGRGMQIELWDGELWITQAGDTRDYVVRAGTSFRVEHEGIVLANSLRGARITLTAPAPASSPLAAVLAESPARRAAPAPAWPLSAPASSPTAPPCPRLSRLPPPQLFRRISHEEPCTCRRRDVSCPDPRLQPCRYRLRSVCRTERGERRRAAPRARRRRPGRYGP